MFRRDRPPAVQLCSYCGYDLTGNVSGVCPECGKPI
jgi:rubrerythrin